MTDKNELVRILEVCEDEYGYFKLGDVDCSIRVDLVRKHIDKYGSDNILKALKKLKKDINKIEKEIK